MLLMSGQYVPLQNYMDLQQQILAERQAFSQAYDDLKRQFNRPEERLESWFSGLLPGEYRIISHLTYQYNCIAWAAGVTGANWWPHDPNQRPPGWTWPIGPPFEPTVAVFTNGFISIGYEDEPNNDPSYHRVYDKVAFFDKLVNTPNGPQRKVQHAARLLRNGRWSSKIGIWEVIEHNYDALCGNGPGEYGQIAKIMRRRKSVQRILAHMFVNAVDPVIRFLDSA